VDKDLPVSDIATMNQIISETISQRRFSLVLLSLFAMIALLLAAIGIHGVMTYWVTQRTREIGIRIALGAKPYDVVKMVIGQGMSLTLIGVAIGLAAALTLTRIMKSLLFSVSATDPATFALIALLLVGVALIASYLPARRATRVDPIAVLKSE
jgi:ABC-type antimicrobial peptide transport system permease subunit